MPKLQSRILLTLAGAALVFLAVSWAIERATLLPGMLDLERDLAMADLERGTAALQDELGAVADLAGKWSGSTDTYRFVIDHNTDYYRSNLATDAFRPDSFDFLSFVNRCGDEVWRGCELGGSRRTIDELPRGKWQLDDVLLQARSPEESRVGIVVTKYGPLLLGCRPIGNVERKAPPNGWVVMGRFLSPARIAKLARQTGLRIAFQPMRDAAETVDAATLRRLADGPGRDLRAIDDDQLFAVARVPGMTSPRDDLLVRVDLPRRVFAQSRSAIAYTITATCLAVIPLFAVLFWLLKRSIVDPLRHLRDHALALRAGDGLTRRCGMVRDDEIGTLAQEFDRMVARLAAGQERAQSPIAQQMAPAFEDHPAETITVAELLAQAVRASAIEGDGVTVEYDHADARLQTQKRHVLDVLVALLQNAGESVRKVAASRRTIRIWTTPINNGLRLTVVDQGVGVDRHDLPGIFLRGATTRPGGAVLDLPTCAEVARRLGGELCAESDGPDRGACFHLDLPAVPALVEVGGS